MSFHLRSVLAGSMLSVLAFSALPFDLPAADTELTSAGHEVLHIDRPPGAGEALVSVLGPDGTHLESRVPADEAVEIGLGSPGIRGLEAGQYLYEVRFALSADAGLADAASRDRREGQTADLVPASIPYRTGTFRVDGDGALNLPQPGIEEGQAGPRAASTRADVLTNNDGVIRPSLCVGFDCEDNEVFSFDTLKLKQNNNRLTFIDTSSQGGFPAGDWQLRANDSQSGGADHFSVDWLGTDASFGNIPVSTPFRIDGTAPSDSIRVSTTGRVGFGTSTPVLDLHVLTANTPGIRLEQSAGGGWTPQTWDVAGNETNFFVRDVTNSSSLPFRIRPGAPTSSLEIGSTGRIGIGTQAPAARLHVADGDVRVDGSVYQLSSRALKTDFGRFDPATLLDLLGNMQLGTWRYRHAPDGGQHFGPAAEDFHAAFGLGDNAESISLADMAGIALGAAQALKHELDDRDARIEALSDRLERLERVLEARLTGLEP